MLRKLFDCIKYFIAKKIHFSSLSYNSYINQQLIKNGNLVIGDYTYGVENLNVNSYIGNDVDIKIGKYCSIAKNCSMIMGGIHPIKWISTYPITERLMKPGFNLSEMPSSHGPIIIKNDVWIASNVVIMSGVTIGNGAVICANAVVTKNIPDYAVVGGVPAKIIKYRFESLQIEQLLMIEWWNWSYNKVIENWEFLSSDKIEELVSKHGFKNNNNE